MSKKCIECGAELNNEALFCDECGTKQPAETTEGALSENEKLAADLERTEHVASQISSCKMLISKRYDELQELEERATGNDLKMTWIDFGLLVLGIILVIVCFRKFGIIVGIISIFVVFKLFDMLSGAILKMKNNMSKEEIKVCKKEYQEQKAKLEQEMKDEEEKIKELEADVAYQRYSYLLVGPEVLRYIPKDMINALKDGRAKTIEEAKKFINQ